MKIRPVIAWYDLWIGLYWHHQQRTLYILPIPCVGIKIMFDKMKGVEF